MPTGGKLVGSIGHIPSLNGLRAVAILIVIYAHAEFPGRVAGAMGVSLFFFLSGFLITTLLRAEFDKYDRISLKDFYIRRALRIFPPMYIVLLVCLVLALLGILPSILSAGGVITSGTFLANYWIVFNGHTGIPDGLGIFWSLAVEEHYYLIFPLAYIAMRKWLPRTRHQVAVLVAVCLLMLAWRCYLTIAGASPLRIYYGTDTRADAILWGSILAIGFNPLYREVRLPKRPWIGTGILIGSALIFFASSRFGSGFHYSVGFTIQSLAAFGIFIPLILAPTSWVGRILNWRPLAWIGIVSYALYLVHRPVLILAETYLPGPHLLQAGVGIAISFAIAWLMKRAVEDPLKKVRRTYSRAGEAPDEPQLRLQQSEEALPGPSLGPTIDRP